MKTIRGKLLVYFLVFVILFQVTAISIFISSNKMMKTYDTSFQRFLILNTISQQSKELYTFTNRLVSNPDDVSEYYERKDNLMKEKENLLQTTSGDQKIELKNYLNTLDTFIHETELTVGFVLLDDLEKYTFHLDETRKASRYIQEATLELLDVELTAYQPFYNDLKKRNDYFFIFTICLFLTTIILAIFFALWFSKGITRPINVLSNAAQEVSKGDFEGELVTIQSNDELKLLADTFNDMRGNIHSLVEEIKEQSKLDQLLKDMELKHLQNQINPHFLFNTLNTLSKMAYLEDAKTTSSLIESVSALLRHSLGEINKSVTLREEIQVVRDYFRIQKIRFSDRIQVIFDIDEAQLDIPIPRLTLQPLVENAFIHGIEELEEGGKIIVRIFQKSTYTVVEVCDDGVGMSEENINQILSLAIREDEHVGHSTGIGLTNVIRRLQLFYQTDDIVQIDSTLGQGTTVRIFIPKSNPRSDADESFNRRR